jgi:hypothetical protein
MCASKSAGGLLSGGIGGDLVTRRYQLPVSIRCPIAVHAKGMHSTASGIFVRIRVRHHGSSPRLKRGIFYILGRLRPCSSFGPSGFLFDYCQPDLPDPDSGSYAVRILVAKIVNFSPHHRGNLRPMATLAKPSRTSSWERVVVFNPESGNVDIRTKQGVYKDSGKHLGKHIEAGKLTVLQR